MGSDDIVVGKSPSNRTPKTVIVDHLAQQAGASARDASSSAAQERRCGAMSQQPFYGGATSIPQKFLHLVGCHEPKGKSEGKSEGRSPATTGKARAR